MMARSSRKCSHSRHRSARRADWLSAVFVVSFFDSLDEMHTTYDHFAGHTSLEASESGEKLPK